MKHPGSLATSTIISFARQIGYAQATGELEPAIVRHQAVNSAYRKGVQNIGGIFRRADEWSDNDQSFDDFATFGEVAPEISTVPSCR